MALPPYESTLCFRRFRIRHTEVSRQHWSTTLAFEVVADRLNTIPPDTFVVDALRPSFPRNMYPLKTKEMQADMTNYLARLRLHLLVMCCANLEAYLKDITFLHVAGMGHAPDCINLDVVGMALTRPILGSSSLIEPLVYAEELFGVKFGVPLIKWRRFYRLRCTAAHNGGYVTPRTLKELPGIGLPLHAQICLSYRELFEALEAADKIVETIDRKVVCQNLKRAEVARELAYLRDAKALPPRKDAMKFLHEEFGYPKINGALKEFVWKTFY